MRNFKAGAIVLAATVSGAQEDTWIDVLKSDANQVAKAAACRALKTEGTAQSVEAVAPLLTDVRLSHEARMALESIPGAEASAALRDAVAKTDGVLRAGILDSIGERRDPEAVAVVAAALDDDDLQVVTSAALALGKIGTAEAVRQLDGAYQQAVAERRTAIGDGLICGAIRRQQSGSDDQAAEIFRKLATPDQPPAIRSAALLGQIQAAGDQRQVMIRTMLADDDPVVQAVAAGALPYLSQPALRAVVADREQLPVASQVLLLAAIRLRGDRSLAPAAIAACDSKETAVARAAIQATGALAGPDALNVTVAHRYDRRPLGRRSMGRGRSPPRGRSRYAADAGLAGQQNAQQQIRFIGALVARKASSSVPTLLDHAASSDDEVRGAAINAIFRLAQVDQVPAIVRLMLQKPRGGERDTLEKAVMLALETIPDADQRTEAVLAGVDLGSDAQRIELLPLLGRIGGERALRLIQAALQDPNPDLYEAGMRAITNWPDASVVELLADLARTARENHQRIWALRAMIRVSALPGPLADDRKLTLLRRAMQMATRDDERALAVQRAAAIRTLDALQFVAPYLDHPRLAPDASRAVVELAHHKELRDPNREAFIPALKKVLAIASDAELKDRARRYLEELGP
jgi:HEAT repeat protein